MKTASGQHTASQFDLEVQNIDAAICKMGGMAIDQLDAALELLQSYDKSAAAQLIKGDQQVDDLQYQIEQMTIQLVTRREPLANDLRYAFTVPKICSSLERIADVACNIARRSRQFTEVDIAEEAQDVIKLGRLVQSMVRDVLRAFETRDSDLARAVYERDDVIDDAYAEQFSLRLSSAIHAKDETSRIISLMFMAKNIERAGDHTTHLAEATYYMIHGEPLPGNYIGQ